MSLIKTTDELKACFSSIDQNYRVASLQSFIDDAEQDILIPWIGQEIYDVISAAYNGGGIAGKKAALLPFLQKAVTHLALWLAADSGSFRIADSGFYVVTTATNKPVSDKKMIEFKRGRRETGYKAMEQAIAFLEKNIAEGDFADYATSDAHALHNAYFINSAVEFTRYFKKVNNSAYLFWQSIDALDFAERTHIAPVLGQAYFDHLKGAVLADSLSNAEKSLMPFIKRALANYTIGIAAPDLPLEFDGTNIIVRSEASTGHFDTAENKTAANPMQMGGLVSTALSIGKTELRNLEDYLIANYASLPGYTLPDPGIDFNINTPDSPTFFV